MAPRFLACNTVSVPRIVNVELVFCADKIYGTCPQSFNSEVILTNLTTVILVFTLAVSSTVKAAGKNATQSNKEVEELCEDKAIRAATAISQINNPGSVQTSKGLKNTKKNRVEFAISLAHDDKTKTYSVTAEFSRENKWCQIMEVRLTGMPQ